MIHEIRRALAFYSRPTRRLWLAMVVLVLVSAIAEAAGAAGVFGLLRILSDPDAAFSLPLVSAIALRLPATDLRSVTLTFTGLLAFHEYSNASP